MGCLKVVFIRFGTLWLENENEADLTTDPFFLKSVRDPTCFIHNTQYLVATFFRIRKECKQPFNPTNCVFSYSCKPYMERCIGMYLSSLLFFRKHTIVLF